MTFHPHFHPPNSWLTQVKTKNTKKKSIIVAGQRRDQNKNLDPTLVELDDSHEKKLHTPSNKR